MKRLTTNDENHILASLNLFYCKDNEVWIRGGGPEPDYADCTLVDWIVSAAEKHHLDIFSRDAEGLGEEMYDSMQFGSDTIEGIVALLHAAAIQAAEMRGHLAAIEDILGDEYDLDHLRKLVQIDQLIGKDVWSADPFQDNKPRDGGVVGYEVYSDAVNLFVNFDPVPMTAYFSLEDIGKTVFMTREEAEEARRREQE